MTGVLPEHQQSSAPAIDLTDTGLGDFTSQQWAAQRRVPLRPWARRYAVGLAIIDLGLIFMAVAGGYLLRFPAMRGIWPSSTQFLIMCGVLVVVWVGALAAVGAYEARRSGTGPEEFKRVIMASGITAGALAVVCYVGRIDVARGFVVVTIPLGMALLLAGRAYSRRIVRAHRVRGDWNYRIVVGGTSESVRHFVEVTRRRPSAGMQVIGACVEDAPRGTELLPGVPVLGGVTDIAGMAESVGADVVALAGAGLGPSTIRELGWSLEGTGRDLVMVPGLTEVAGPRVHVSPVDGLPMMWVERPVLSGYKRILKRGFDLASAGAMLVLLSPLLGVLALAIKADSKGPVFFTQTRYGKSGQPFRIWKFRSMTTDAAEQHSAVQADAGAEGELFFKVRADPRVTRVGKVLRKLSLDELPQLINVVNGSMSLVGPRPQVHHEVVTYDGATRRRLLVKPGMTGLWQVSGRSDLSPEDGVRLDLYYVENWSLAMDFAILGRTVHTVLRGHGAY